MTIAVIWQEDNWLWCVADTRLVIDNNRPTTEITSKIYSIPVVLNALDNEGFSRIPHYWRQYGFVFSGSVPSATMTAITASTLLQKLAFPGTRTEPPKFEVIADFIRRLAEKFTKDRRQFGDHGLFSAAFFGWCPHEEKYKIAHIEGREDCGSLRVEISFPARPDSDGETWLKLGSATASFGSMLENYLQNEPFIKKRVPRRVVDKMISEESDPTVGGSISIGAANEHGFELLAAFEPITVGQPQARRMFNGLDLDLDVGPVGHCFINTTGIA